MFLWIASKTNTMCNMFAESFSGFLKKCQSDINLIQNETYFLSAELKMIGSCSPQVSKIMERITSFQKHCVPILM